MKNYYNEQAERAISLIKNEQIFNGDRGNGEYRKKLRPFVLRNYKNNFFIPFRLTFWLYMTFLRLR
jgi:hypothetical protein